MSIKIHLIPDQYHLPYVGKTSTGALYWIDIQLNSEEGNTRDFIATYVFDTDGRLIWNEIKDLGLRTNTNQLKPSDVAKEMMAKIGAVETTDIWVSPFAIKAHKLIFGLVVRETDEGSNEDFQDDEMVLVDAMPGWTMMFYPPWEEGLYDT